MVFAKRLREGIRRGRIRCSVRIWTGPHVKAGGRYDMDEGQIVVDSIVPIRFKDITRDLAQESGFDSVKDLLQIARHGRGRNIYLVRFHYLAPGAWDVAAVPSAPVRKPTLLQRIRRSSVPSVHRPAEGARRSRNATKR